MIPSRLMRTGALLLMAALAGCAGGEPGPDGQLDEQGGATVCRIGPDGGPPAGTVSDRGIGGTGAPATVADRGIGGTGIIGVVTGFASVCINGLEVSYDASVSVDIDGARSPAARLRAGQVVAVRADGPPSAPHARSISVRPEVAGRIEAVRFHPGTLTVGGQPVAVPPGTLGAERLSPGDWVSVSGLRRPDGAIVALRVDRAPAGMLKARGSVSVTGGVTRLGALTLPHDLARGLRAGEHVTVSGAYVAGRPVVRAIAPDPLLDDPGGYFGPAVRHLVIEAYVRVENRSLVMYGLKVPIATGVPTRPGREAVAIVSLDRDWDSALTAVRVRYTDPGRTIAAARVTAGRSGTRSHDRRPAAGPPSGAAAPALPAALPDLGDVPEVAEPAAVSDPPGTAAVPESLPPSSNGALGPPNNGTSGGIPLSNLYPPDTTSLSAAASQAAGADAAGQPPVAGRPPPR